MDIRRRDDAGMAILMSLILVVISGTLIVTMITYTLSETRQSGHARQRGSGIALAEGQVDAMMANITSVQGTALPCSANVVDSSTPPDTVTVATSVTYYDGSNSALSCPLAPGASPVTAVIKAVATSQRLDGTQPARRVMEATVRLIPPVLGMSLTKAIFGQQNVVLTNNATINGSVAGAADADIYTNGSFSCGNSQDIRGSVHSQGAISMANSCDISGDGWAGSGFTASSPGNSVGGSVTVSNGNATLGNGVSVTGGVRASGTISWNGCPAQCTSGASIPTFPVEPFPHLSWNADTQSAWQAQGYATVVTNNDCTLSSGVNGPGQWLVDNAATLSGPTVLRTTCPLVLGPHSATIRLNNDIAVFADGGISLGSNLDLTSTGATTRKVYLVQPYDTAPTPCSGDSITINNQVTIDSSITMLLYSPCGIHKSNLSALNGQIYSGTTVTSDNQLTLNYVSLPAYGLTDGNGGGQNWKLDLLNKQDTT
jgi:hypothetical protein